MTNKKIKYKQETKNKFVLRNINKKATTLLNNEVLEIIIAAAGFLILVILFFKFLAPAFDKDAETTKSYFENLKKAIASADSTGTGDFYIQNSSGWVLVYFGNATTYTNEYGITFHISQKKKNQACICSNYFIGRTPVCNKNYCLSLAYPAEWPGGTKENFVVGSPAKIEKKDAKYLFSSIP